ncbi:cupin domain-containing protein [Kitasatospora sp. NPDC127116]|uniref:cupin domain-containing protein n=1 Tax=Kitasatospora sp. NPDC127116 TaxID=3345367 RepID=UPI00336D89D7
MINSFPTFGAAPEREPFWFLGGQARILLPGSATGNALSLMEFSDPIGHAPPLHVHENEDELWFVLDGEVSFFVGDERHDLVPGQVAHGPRGVPHSYLVRSEGARLAVVFSPACIEEWFKVNGIQVAEAGDLPPAFDLGAVVASAEAFRLRVAGPPPTL